MTTSFSFDEKYQAVCRRDSSFVGVFFTAVKTTGIFCQPTCTARTPKPENVEFFETPKEAILHGYRPCKVCKPMELFDQTPSYIRNLLKELQAEPSMRLKEEDLRQRGIEPAGVRRWFKKHHGMTFSAYQRMLRLNRAYRELSNGELVAATAFRSGYESLSGFADGFRSALGASPSHSSEKSVIHMTRLATPIGPMFACATEDGVCLCEFTDRRMLETELHDLQKRLNAVILPSQDNPHLRQLEAELRQYFEGTRQVFEVALDTPTTPFRQNVWEELLTIPYGQTRSYSEQARRIGKPRAVRAVGSANGHNRIAIVIPCHRVIGSDGSLTGYGGGLARKKWLLDFERRHASR